MTWGYDGLEEEEDLRIREADQIVGSTYEIRKSLEFRTIKRPSFTPQNLVYVPAVLHPRRMQNSLIKNPSSTETFRP